MTDVEPTPVPTDTGTSAGRRLLLLLSRPHRSQVVVAVLLAAVGFGAVLQVRSTDATNAYNGYRQQDLIDILSGLSGTTQRTQSEIDRLEKSRSQLLTATNSRETALKEAQKQLDALTVLAGYTAVHGPGVSVVIAGPGTDLKVNTFLNLIEELRSAGAESLAVNNTVRIVASSTFDVVDGALVIDGTRLTTPVTVEAIGDAATLAGAVNFARGPKSQLEDDGMGVTVTQVDDLQITATKPRPAN